MDINNINNKCSSIGRFHVADFIVWFNIVPIQTPVAIFVYGCGKDNPQVYMELWGNPM